LNRHADSIPDSATKGANGRGAKPAELPCVLLDLLKQFLGCEPGNSVLHRSEWLKIKEQGSLPVYNFTKRNKYQKSKSEM